MGRTTVYNNIATPELIEQILPKNLILTKDFLDYLKSVDRAKTTIEQYHNDLKIFFVWNLLNNDNKEFIKITKREFSRFQNYALEEWQWSPKRIRRVKSVLSSLSNFIENILDEEEEFEGYRKIVNKIESPVDEAIREKTIFEPEELQELLDHLIEEKEYLKACTVALAMYSGRRKSELTRFKLSYFTDENVIFGSLYKTYEKVTTKGRGSKGKLLYLYVFKKDFDPYLELWKKEREEKNIEGDWLICGEDGNPISISMLDRWCQEFSKFLGKPFYFHALRHFYTTQCMKSNLPESVVQELIGWSSAEMVKIYDDRKTDDILSGYFDENGIKQVEKKSLSDM